MGASWTYWIKLVTTPQPFGGRRWWFLCPQTGRRATKLHLPEGAFTFASGQADGAHMPANANNPMSMLRVVLSS